MQEAKLKNKITTTRLKRQNLKTPLPTPAKKCSKSTQVDEKELGQKTSFDSVVQAISARKFAIKNLKYSNEIKEFAMQLHYYSPKAYDFLRTLCQNRLPCPRTFNIWTAPIDTKPGFLNPSISYLKQKILDSQYEVYFALTIDEISIRQQFIYNGSKITGFVDYGDVAINDKLNKQASNALFIMVTEVNGTQKIPIGYLLTNGADSALVASVVRRSLEIMNTINGRVLTITSDGLPSNLAAIEQLGANLEICNENFKPYITCPFSSQKIYVYPDPCHNIKLIRNALEAYGCFFDSDGNVSMQIRLFIVFYIAYCMYIYCELSF